MSAGGDSFAGDGSATGGRALGLWALLALGVNGIIGVGIFFTPNLVAGFVPGVRGVWAYLLTLLALLPVAVTYAKLGARFDQDGGPCVWAKAAFGPAVGFVVGCAAYASAVLSTSAVLAGLGQYSAPLLGVVGHQVLSSIVFAVALALVVATGLRPSAWLWSSLTVLKLVPLLALFVAVLYKVEHLASAPLGSPAATAPAAWGRAVLLIVFSMQGFEIVPVPGAHVQNPGLAIPLATVASLLLCGLFYMALHWTCVRAVPDLALAGVPLVAAARSLGGEALAGLVRAGSNVSALGIAFGMMAMTPRYLAAVSALAPRGAPEAPAPALANEGRREVPRRAVFVTLVLVSTLLGWGELSKLFVLSSVAVLFQYSISVLALGCLAVRRRHGLLPRDALSAAVSLVALGLVASAVERAELQVLAAIVLASVLLWFARVRRLS